MSREGGGQGTDCESGHVVRHDRGVWFSIDGRGERLEGLREGRVVEILERLERRSGTGKTGCRAYRVCALACVWISWMLCGV